jgi:hypothetical protein
MGLGRAGLAVGLLGLLAAPDVRGQANEYEARYGTPVPVSIDDLVTNPGGYSGRAIKTKGQLELGMGSGRVYLLKDQMARGNIRLYPMPDVEAHWNEEAMKFTGREVEITGVFNETGALGSSSGADRAFYSIQFWKYLGPPPDKDSKEVLLKSDAVPLETLATKLGSMDGKNVRVIGMYRGRNLFGDLPAKSERDADDWVIKDDVYSVWITGKKPRGSGWELDLQMKRDTNKWIEVVGKPETIKGVTYIRAIHVALSNPPRVAAVVAAPTPPPPKPKVPPVVVFSLPLDGERDIPPAGVFKVQFSKDMDEDSFKGRVVFRYVGPRLPGDREFVGVKIGYEGGRRALVVDPGDVLRAGRVVEIRLLPGIVDIDGLELTPRPGKDATAQTSDILRFQVAPANAAFPPS